LLSEIVGSFLNVLRSPAKNSADCSGDVSPSSDRFITVFRFFIASWVLKPA